MLKLSISARFSTGMKLSWKADAEEGDERKHENRLKQERENVLEREGGGEREREREKQRERQNKREIVLGRVSMGIRNGKFFSFSQLGWEATGN